MLLKIADLIIAKYCSSRFFHRHSLDTFYSLSPWKLPLSNIWNLNLLFVLILKRTESQAYLCINAQCRYHAGCQNDTICMNPRSWVQFQYQTKYLIIRSPPTRATLSVQKDFPCCWNYKFIFKRILATGISHTWRLHDMEMLSILLTLCVWNILPSVVSPHKGTSNVELWCFFVANLNKL